MRVWQDEVAALADGTTLAAGKGNVVTAEIDALWREIKAALAKKTAPLASPTAKKTARPKGGRNEK